MDFTKIHSNLVKLKEIAHKVGEGTSDASDITAVTSISKIIVDDIVALNDNFKIIYEPNKMVVNSIVERSIYVAMMSTALGYKMNLSKDRLVKLCLAALLKDIALVSPKIKIEKRDILLHPIRGYAYLKEHYTLEEEILNTVLQHHELFDGSGYPRKLEGEEICEFARIIGIIEMFYEIKSNHSMFNENCEMFESKLNRMIKMFDMKILSYFFANTELFNLDTLVRLNNGDIAIIIQNNYTNIFKPVIKILKSQTYPQGEIIDLQKHSRLKIHKIEYYVED